MSVVTPDMAEAIRRRYVPGVFGMRTVAREFGVSTSTIRRIVKPDVAERWRAQSLEAKRRRIGTCEICGGETRYNGHRVNGPSRICAECSDRLARESRYWTRERIIEAIQEWAAEHGSPPRANDWDTAGARHPAKSSVYRYRKQSTNPFATWADAIEAAGFPRPRLGRRPKQASAGRSSGEAVSPDKERE